MTETPQTFLFADLAGFTALTEAHGDEQAADHAAELFSCVRELLPRHAAEEVKTIGDAVMDRALRSGEQAGDVAIDPVCRMSVEPSNCAGKLTHDGVEYHFCSLECAAAFAADPERHVPGSD